MKATSRLVTVAGDWLDQALQETRGSVLLTSPYLSYDVCARLARAATDRPDSVVIVTTLNPIAAARGYLSVAGLERLLLAGATLRHVERLHAKCFIVGPRGMAGSANLTGSGLGTSAQANRELGIELAPADVRAARAVIESWQGSEVTQLHLGELEMKAVHIAPTELVGDVSGVGPLSTPAEGVLGDGADPTRALWLKLHHGDPMPDRWSEDSWFASPKRGKPSIATGDLVVMCSKASRDCYAVVEVTSEPEWQPADYATWAAENNPDSFERWPWVNRTKPRLAPPLAQPANLEELGIRGQGTRNGHVRLTLDQFVAAVRALDFHGVG